ncbi:unnamed protein product [Ceratitis capitata]|uniref:(Mediterranean fruit fly) hypothetical protein n=3 Tax=Ceratitis capitata TaxID=7213 RepID=A0A811URP2_CERCA|nr:unnamed protein product [Ceratitis capitata]
MAHNDIIRPSMLASAPRAAAPPLQPNPLQPNPPTSANATPELRNIIRDLMREILATEEANIVRTSTQTMTDQIIEERFRDNLTDMDKVPDVVRSLREFGGNPAEYSSWKKSVERILKIYEPNMGSPKYFGILNVIRNKIVGSADAALESYNTPLNWKAISKCLTMHYADKRDLSTLEYQMTCLLQGRRTVHEFYAEVYSHLSLILNKIACMDINEEAMRILTHTYRDKALDTFVRGLSGDLSRLLGMKEPADLPEALHLCIKLENQNFRTIHANNQYSLPRKPNLPLLPLGMHHQHKPPIPQRNINHNNQPFYPQLAHIPQAINPINRFSQHPQYRQPQYQYHPQYQYQPQYQQQQRFRPNQFFNTPPRPIQPKPPIPMEVDESLQTRNVNYMNRPNKIFAGKRPIVPSNQIRQPFKQSRINNIIAVSAPQDEEQTSKDYYDQYSAQDNNSNDNILEENEYEFSDIHFLD